ncbi:MAG: hypothetical protein FWD79_10515 [Desulfobulbus sp.]|nr:hypothetical protein [Desulfobulbus sp.]
MRYTGNIGKALDNEDGIALVTALMLGLFGMLLVAALLLMVRTGTWMSGSQKRYQTALAAAYGGNDFFVKEVIQRGIGGADLNANNYGGLLLPVATNDYFDQKLRTTGNYANDPVDAIITFAAPQGAPQGAAITVQATIVGTSKGNSSGSAAPPLSTGGVVNNGSGTMTPQHVPFLYQVRAEAQNAAHTIERARLSSLYVY